MRNGRIIVILAIALGAVLVLCLAMAVWAELGVRQKERRQTGYLAELGQVPATYRDVTTFLNREFPTGTTKSEVVSKLDAYYIYRFIYGQRDRPAQSWEWIAFPGKDCTLESFRNDQAGDCTIIVFIFGYQNGLLQTIEKSDSP